MLKSIRTRRFAPIAAMLLFALVTTVTLAHPLGNFTINHYARLVFSPDHLRVRYVLDFAEIPTFQEKQTMDANSDGTIGEGEKSAYLESLLAELETNLLL